MPQNKIRPTYDPLLDEFTMTFDPMAGITMRNRIHFNVRVLAGYTKLHPNLEVPDEHFVEVHDGGELVDPT